MQSLFIGAILFLLTGMQLSPSVYDKETKLLNDGLKLEQEEKVSEALNLWENAFTLLDGPSFPIGREYIRIVTEYDLKDKYKLASSMYLWGLSARTITESNLEATQTEIEMLRVIANENEYSYWVELLEQKDPQLFSEIFTFWQKLDPTPATIRYNERLLEHWERIAHAKKNYTRNRNTVFKSDDRGSFYVRFGAPDYISSAYLEASRGQVTSLCDSFGFCDAPTMTAAIFELHDRPYVEVWVYYSEEKYEDNTIIIFGGTGTDPFRQVYSLEDLIPFRAFSFSTRYDRTTLTAEVSQQKVSPGQIMQFLYYQQMSAQDEFFARRFNDLDFMMTGDQERVNRSQGIVMRSRTKSEARKIMNQAPDEISTYERLYFGMNMESYHYRFIDENNNPYTLSFVETFPTTQFANDYGYNDSTYPSNEFDTENVLKDYSLEHTIKVLDGNDELFLLTTMPVNLILDANDEIPSSSVFRIPNPKAEKQNVVLSAMLRNDNPGTKPRYDTPFEPEVRGYGTIEEELPSPLKFRSDKLLMGDVVFGYQLNPNPAEGVLFPFVVSNRKSIPRDEVMAVHLQIYNLALDQDNLSRFSIEYSITEPRKILTLFGQKEVGVSLKLDLVHDSKRFTENLEIQSRDLEPGDYVLRLTVTDTVSGQTFGRNVDFKVTESSDSLSDED